MAAASGYPAAESTPAIRPTCVSTVYSNEDLRGIRVLRPLGVVRGVVVRSRNAIAQIGAGFKSMAGGEIKTFTTLCEGARQQALDRMLEHAAELSATGVVGVRYDTNLIAPGMTEVIAYGTAVSDVSAATSSNEGPAGLENGARVTTSNEIPGFQVQQSLGIVQGLTVRSRNVFANIGAGLKSIVGGEIKTYTKMCEDCRKEAYSRMIAEAVEKGADAVVAVRYQTGEITDGVTEVLCFGTAISSTPGATPTSGTFQEAAHALPVTSSNFLPGLDIKDSLGVAQGITVRSSNLFANIGAGFKTLVGGEIHTWTRMCQASRQEAFTRMLEQAQRMGGKAIIAMRYDTNQVNNGMVEVTAYGTVVSDASVGTVAAATIDNAPNAADLALVPRFVTTDVDLPGQGDSHYSLGLVRGVSVQSVNLILGIGAGFKSMVGGEIRNYTGMCENARAAATEQMMQHAVQMGATAIIGFRYECNDLVPGTVEVIAYGTAVSTRPPAQTTHQYGVDVSLVSTTNKLPRNDTRESLGIVRGITVRSRNIISNFGAGLKAGFIGGEINTWRELCDQARLHAYERMLEEAAKLHAKGVVGVRFETNELSPGITEVIAYGTAVA